MLDQLFRCTVTWLAPMLCFTAEEAWLSRAIGDDDGSVHLELFPEVPAAWRDDALAEKWRKVRLVRRVVTGALEIERASKRIGSSLEAGADRPRLRSGPVRGAGRCRPRRGLHHLGRDAGRRTKARPTRSGCRRCRASRSCRSSPRARKCARSWKISPAVGTDPQYPDVTPRDAQALREWDAMRKAAE